jgi:CRP/FNR family cyclic AMP-dependent transcriptional regulator
MHGRPVNGTWPAESFLGRLTAGERDALLARGGYAAYQPGQHLLVNGDRGGFVILVHAGQVKVVMQDEQGTEHLLGIRARGSLLGEQSYVDGQPRSASVVALNQVRASSIAWDKFDLYLRDFPRVSMEIARVLANRLRASDQTGRDIHGNRVPVRVVNLLVSLADDFAEPGARRSVIPLSQAEVAQLAHAAEVTVNRVLREFRDQRMVGTAYRKVIVPCVVCLDRLATAVSADPKDGAKGVLGCGGTDSHR